MKYLIGLAFSLCLTTLAPAHAHAQIPNATANVQPTQLPAREKRSRINVTAGSAIRINYGQPSWNRSAKEIDTAVVIMREGVSGRIVQVQLNETAPDSSIFTGRYSINWQNMEQLQTEFYIPSQAQLTEKDGLIKVTSKITSRELKRNPFIMRRLPNGEQSIEIFDTRDQAQAAMRAYKTEQLVVLQNQKATQIPSNQDLETEQAAELQREREDAARAASDRVRMQQLESKRLSDMIAAQAAMTEQERTRKQGEAAELAKEGLIKFRANDFEGARSKFDQAIALDPDNRMFYFQYGVSLYKTEDFNRSLVLLGLAQGKDVNPIEKNYFLALNHVKLKETDAALKSFSDVIASKDPVMGPSAEFYRGALLYEREEYSEAKTSFQAVLDTSKDPLLDERAEAYIEQILRAQQIADERSHRWTLSASVGEMYDSNILLTSNSQRDSGTATNAAGWRSLLSGSARYRAIYTDTNEFAGQVDLVTLYSVNDSFKSDQSIRNADPTVATLTLPWTHKGVWLGKGHKLDIIPGYESTIMSIEGNESKIILNSALFSVANLFVMNDRWFSSQLFDARLDQSQLTSSVGDDDASAVKVRFGTTNLLFLNDKKDQILIPEGGLTFNQAKGKNATYTRLDLGVGYLMPWKWETTANFKLGYFYLDYAQKGPERTDNSLTFTSGLSKKLSEIWSGGLLGSYNMNQSNETPNTYNKFTVLATLSAAYGF